MRKSAHKIFLSAIGILTWMLLCMMMLTACHYNLQVPPSTGDEEQDATARDSIELLQRYHFTLNDNLVLTADSLNLACLPLKNCTNMIYKGQHVVIAEIRSDTTDFVNTKDSVWIKVAHSETVQGWVRQTDLKQCFVPNDSISQAINLFSGSYVATFLFIICTFIAFWLVRLYQEKPFKMVYFNDIDSLYPLLLCLLVSCSATLYESLQLFAPDCWEIFYYAPQFSPFGLPLLLALFIASLWLIVIVAIAAIGEVLQRLSAIEAFTYLIGLVTGCIFCYLFFILSTSLYVGYAFLLAFILMFVRMAYRATVSYPYICGHCGQKLHAKGVCPRCGALND